MMLDTRLIGTKCEKCINGRDLMLDSCLFTVCANCTDRPLRNKDKSRFEPDLQSEDIRELLDKDSIIGTPLDY